VACPLHYRSFDVGSGHGVYPIIGFSAAHLHAFLILPLMVQKGKQRGRVLLNLVLFFISTAAAILTVDLFFQWYWKIPSPGQGRILIRYVEHQLPRKRLNPNLDIVLTAAYREYQYHVTTDENGFRNSIPSELNGEGERDILILGDSQTFGAGVNDDQTFASLISKGLNRSVLNTGVPGYNNIEELELAKTLFNRYQSKVVILALYVGNDPYENYRNRNMFLSSAEASKAKEAVSTLAFVKDYLKRNSSIYNGLTRFRRFEAVNDFLYGLGLIQNEPPGELAIYQKESKNHEAYWSITEQVLAQLNQLVTQHSAQFVLVLVPDRLQIDLAYQSQWVKKYRLDPNEYDFLGPNSRLQTFSEKHGILFLDPTALFQQKHKQGIRPFWAIDHHLAPAGHKIISELISKHLAK
jgi:hypothetical protein